MNQLYSSSAKSDNLSLELCKLWTQEIMDKYNLIMGLYREKNPSFGNSFSIFPNDRKMNNDKFLVLEWNAHPRMLQTCMGYNDARVTCDFYSNTSKYQVEYCEYRIVKRKDKDGKLRPKRIQVTTEFKEYWQCLAGSDPSRIRELIENFSGKTVTWASIYQGDPMEMSVKQRRDNFTRLITGTFTNGGWVPPLSYLNESNAICMVNEINGLSDLLYTLMSAAVAYIEERSNNRQKIVDIKNIIQSIKTSDEVGSEEIKKIHSCTNSDPTIVKKVYDYAYEGNVISLNDPPGIYIVSFNDEMFLVNDEPVPKEWIRWTRGFPESPKYPQRWQHLEFGPSDDDPFFLGDISVSNGVTEEPLKGGYQILEQIEVGIRLNHFNRQNMDELFFPISVKQGDTTCNDSETCREMKQYLENAEKYHQTEIKELK